MNVTFGVYTVLRDAGVGRGQLLGVALAAVPPLDRQVVAGVGGPSHGLGGDRRVRVLAQL